MTRHLSPARLLVRAPVARALSRPVTGRAGNDNAGPAAVAEDAEDAVLHAALRHFAAHGLGAARAARIEAERAFAAGDPGSYGHWLGICRALDRRMAGELARRHADGRH